MRPAARLGAENPLPPLDGCMPHRLQDNYDRIKEEREFRVVVLENDILRAILAIFIFWQNRKIYAK